VGYFESGCSFLFFGFPEIDQFAHYRVRGQAFGCVFGGTNDDEAVVGYRSRERKK
jgi:hypothetical protein